MPTNGGGPDFATISTFFGAKDNGDGTYSHVPERIPDNWFNRASPYTLTDVNNEINAQYLASPVLFGFNAGYQNFLALNTTTGIVNGKFSPNTANDVACVIQQAVLAAIPSTIQGCEYCPGLLVIVADGQSLPLPSPLSLALRAGSTPSSPRHSAVLRLPLVCPSFKRSGACVEARRRWYGSEWARHGEG